MIWTAQSAAVGAKAGVYEKGKSGLISSLNSASDAVQADLVGSLQARMDILMAEAEDLAGTAGAGSSSRPALLSQPHTDLTLPLPARVFFPVKVLSCANACMLPYCLSCTLELIRFL